MTPTLGYLNIFTFVLTCLSGLVLITDMANNFYYCGKLALKSLILRLIITNLGTLRTTRLA